MGAVRSSARKNGTKPTLLNGPAARAGAASPAARGNGAKLSARILLVEEGRLRKVLRMIESNPSRKINDLALECNLSQSHLQHLFKQHTGLGLGRLLTEHRMQRAAGFLAETNMSVKEIACAIGYEHTSSFTRAFERHFRQAPRHYRQGARRLEELTKSRAV
jgi:transcriptional regulator GlxA family with amidase domain